MSTDLFASLTCFEVKRYSLKSLSIPLMTISWHLFTEEKTRSLLCDLPSADQSDYAVQSMAHPNKLRQPVGYALFAPMRRLHAR